MNVLGKLGAAQLNRWRVTVYLLSVVATVMALAVQPRYWPRTVRNVLARQIYFTGIEAVRFVAWVGILVGFAVVLQAQVWLTRVGQSALVGPLLVAVVIRELGPLLTCFVVIGRSGTAMASEMASMRMNREVNVLEAQGLDPFTYLVLPRVVGCMVAVLCLSVVFVIVSFAGGFVCGFLMGMMPGGCGTFFDSVFKAITPADVFNVLAKTLIPGALTGVICCTEGLSIEGAATEVPQAAGRAVIKSVAALFVTSAVVSLLTYL